MGSTVIGKKPAKVVARLGRRGRRGDDADDGAGGSRHTQTNPMDSWTAYDCTLAFRGIPPSGREGIRTHAPVESNVQP